MCYWVLKLSHKDAKIITDTLKFLETDEWISVDELSKEVPFEDGNLEKFVSHLDNLGFVDFDGQNDKIRLKDMGEDVLDLPPKI